MDGQYIFHGRSGGWEDAGFVLYTSADEIHRDEGKELIEGKPLASNRTIWQQKAQMEKNVCLCNTPKIFLIAKKLKRVVGLAR